MFILFFMGREELAEYLSERFKETEMSIDHLAVLAFPYLEDPLRTVQEHARRLEAGARNLLPANRALPRDRARILERVAVSVYWIDQCIGEADKMNERIGAVYPDFKPVDLGGVIDDITSTLPKLDRVDRGLVASTAHTLLQQPKYKDS